MVSPLYGSCTDFAEVAINEMLNCPKRCVVCFFFMTKQHERISEFRMQRLCTIAHHWQPAALRGAVFCKSCDDDMTTWFHSPEDGTDICRTILFGYEKVENSTVVPNIVFVGRKIYRCNIRLNPVNR